MHMLRLTALAAAAWLFAAHAAHADAYAIDKGHTVVSFSWERQGLSRQQGRFTDMNGTLTFDPQAPETAALDVTIRASSLQTGVDPLDRHLRSADFFDVANHPVITFKSTAVRRTGDKTGEVAGDLTILGTSKPVTLAVTWVFTGPHPQGQLNPSLRDRIVSAFSARTTVKRSQWGLSRALPLIGDDIQIVIETEFLRR